MVKNELDFIKLYDTNGDVFCGANQYWLKNKFHSISGCGPTVASEILTYISLKHRLSLYDYNINHLRKSDFCNYIVSVREFVKPGIKGLTDIDYFVHQLKSYAKAKDVKLISKVLNIKTDKKTAFNEIIETIDAGYPLAILILRNPHPEINDFTWHWMSITGYDKDNDTITICTHGKKFALNFSLIWLNDPKYVSELVWFKPEDI